MKRHNFCPDVRLALAIGVFVTIVFTAMADDRSNIIGVLTKLSSPVILSGDAKYAYRDPAALFHDGTLYLFYTFSENVEDGGYYNMTAVSTSQDMASWSKPRILTPRDRNLNYSSPGNVVRINDEWVLCLQSYPTPNKETFGNGASRLFILRSKDLVDWSRPELLRVKGKNVAVEHMGRMIDPYLLEDKNEPGKWWCFYKQNGVSMSYSHDLTNWTYVGRAHAGENVTILGQGDEYVMFHSPRNGIGVKRSKRPDQWGDDTQRLTLGQEDWPWAQGRLTAATVIDLRHEPGIGKYVMFFHGSTRAGLKVQPAHGAASMAVAWSEDLRHWEWPGKHGPGLE